MLTDYQKKLIEQLQASGLSIEVIDEPTGTGKSDVENKCRLLCMAAEGEPRPQKEGGRSQTVKERLLDLAAKGEPRPQKKASKSADENKSRLLDLAAKGEPRPQKKNGLGVALLRYCNQSSYDPEFSAEIRRLRPDWFTSTATRVSSTKDELLELANSGAVRPRSNIWEWYRQNPLPSGTAEEAEHAEDVYNDAIREQRLGRALINYTNKSRKTYDAAFDEKIRALRPDWFSK